MACWGIAAVLFLTCALWICFHCERKTAAPEMVIFGDSVYGEYREAEDAVWKLIQSSTGRTILNGALGGTEIARNDQNRYMDNTWDGFSFAALSKSVVSSDFGVQQQFRVESVATEYYPEVIDQLDEVDFRKVSTLLIGYGLNDYQIGMSLDNPENPMDEYTFGGALRSSLSAIQKRYPALRIILLTPTYSWYPWLPEGNECCENVDWGGGYLESYVDFEKQVAAEYGVEVVDLFDLYERGEYDKWKEYTRDGIHPNENGRRLIAERIVRYLEDNP